MSNIKTQQIRQIYGLLRDTEETAWKDEWVALASSDRVYGVSDLLIEEAHIMISMLKDVLHGNKKPLNPGSRLAKIYQPQDETARLQPQASTQSNKDKANRLRRNVLRHCHDMGWYLRKDDIIVLKNNKPVLDYARIDNYCLTHSTAKKKLNEQSIPELAKLVYQFQEMAKNTIFNSKKSNK